MRRRPQWLGPALATLASVAGIWLAFEVVQAILGSGGDQAIATSPEFVVWTGLIAVGLILYVRVFAHLIGPVRAWAGGAGIGLSWSVAAYAAVVAAVLLVATGHGPTNGVRSVYPVLWLAYGIGVVGAGPAVIGLWLLPVRLSRVAALDYDGAAAPSAAVTELMACRADLTRCLTGLSLIVSSAVLNTGALRTAQLAHGLDEKEFPPVFIVIYGGALAVIVAAVYVPAFLAWRTGVRSLLDTVYPIPDNAKLGQDWLNGRNALAGLLGSELTVGKAFNSAFGILAPLVSSSVTLLVPVPRP